MTNISIYHNPECSKSRTALALREENDVSPKIIYYLETPSNIGDLKCLLGKFGPAAAGHHSQFGRRLRCTWSR